MKKIKLPPNWFLYLIVLVLTVNYLGGIQGVPFHPDESTAIFMSSDFETFFTKPTQLFWNPNNEQDLRQHYRELDAPLSRYLIGFGRWISGLPATTQDWNWSANWDVNQQSGALPNSQLLLVARLSVAILFPFSLLLLFGTVRRIGNTFTAWATVILFALNALILLHTRRAMSESALVFTTILTIWSFVRFDKFPWIIAIPAALAFNAKQSAGVLALVGILAVFVISLQKQKLYKKAFRNLVLYGFLFIGVTLLLNPFLWSNPIQAAIAAVQSRQTLLNQQMVTLASVSPEKSLTTIPSRFVALLAQLYFTPPAIADVSNYLQQTHTAETFYLSNPLNHLFRDLSGGAILLFLTLSGLIYNILQIVKAKGKPRELSFLTLAGIAQLLSLGLVVSLPYQRYCISLVPFICIWSAVGLNQIVELITKIKNHPPLLPSGKG
ncbi:MAG: phospholipid carrier-dependent glycosyltransferase [Anaerolineaceae bacterium]|nr:phospholipid carrier-dependent glycosyltransferase [Anaerolineaceae bacterium]